MSLQSTIPQYQLYGQPITKHAELDFHIQTIAAFNEKFDHYHHPHRHPNLYQLSWITGGTGVHSMDTQSFPLAPNSLYLLAPGIVHTCHSSNHLSGFVLHFSPAFLPSSIIPLADNTFQFIKVQPTDSQYITDIFTKIHQEFNEVQKGQLQMIQSLITMLLIYKDRLVFKQTSSLSTNRTTDISQQFQWLVNTHFTTNKRLAFYAKTMNISVAHLKDCVKATTGIAASELIQKRVILEAKRQLIYSQLSISEIAYQLGFRDANYFFKFFRRHVGQSAGVFRKERREG